MSLTAGLTALYAFPAYSVETAGNGHRAHMQGVAQSIDEHLSADAITVERDGYSVKLAPKVLVKSQPPAYTSTAPTFTNNPSSPVQWPFLVGVPISDGFGPRIAPCSACSSFHDGMDMNPGAGTPIQVIADGVVRKVSAFDNGGLGVYAIIDHLVDGELVSSLYAHMLVGSLDLSPGQTVRVGEQVGNVGNTGISTGAHLHFGLLLNGSKPTDPFAWLTAHVAPA